MTGLIDAYRTAAEDIATGIAVVATRRGNLVHAVTVDSFLDVSYDPPTMLVSLYEGARITEAVVDAERWTLSILREDQADVAQWLGTPGQPIYGLMDSVPTHESPAGLPLVDGCIAWFELRTTAVLPAATHLLVVGEVTACGREQHSDGNATAPLVRFDQRYRRLRD